MRSFRRSDRVGRAVDRGQLNGDPFSDELERVLEREVKEGGSEILLKSTFPSRLEDTGLR